MWAQSGQMLAGINGARDSYLNGTHLDYPLDKAWMLKRQNNAKKNINKHSTSRSSVHVALLFTPIIGTTLVPTTLFPCETPSDLELKSLCNRTDCYIRNDRTTDDSTVLPRTKKKCHVGTQTPQTNIRLNSFWRHRVIWNISYTSVSQYSSGQNTAAQWGSPTVKQH